MPFSAAIGSFKLMEFPTVGMTQGFLDSPGESVDQPSEFADIDAQGRWASGWTRMWIHLSLENEVT